MSLTTTQFANDYVNALTAQGVTLSNATSFKATFAAQLTDWLGGGDAIPADLAYRLTEALNRVNAETASRLDWLTGTATGGPNNDGYYIATAPDGTPVPFPSLAKTLAVLQAAAGVTNLSFSRTGTSLTVLSSSGADATLPAASTTEAGVMTAADKSKLNGIPTGGGVGITNLTFSRTASNLTVVSDTGTDAALPAASTTEAGVMTAADKVKLDGLAPTNLTSTRTATSVTVISDTGADVTLGAATATEAGVMSAADKVKLDGLGGGGGGGGSTNLTFSRTASSVTVLSDTGTDAVLPAATSSEAGVMSAADKSKLDGPPPMARGSITNLNLANDGTNPNTHITISTGQARDSTDSFDLRLTTGLVKRLDQAWAAGTGAGALDTGSVAANTGYWVHLIRRTSDGALDVLMSTSATNPTLPSGYGAFRRLGAVLTNASGFIRKFTQRGDYFELYERTADFAGVANGAGPYLRQLVCPKGVPLKLRVFLQSTPSTVAGSAQVVFSGVFDPALGVPQLATLKRAQIRREIFLNASSQQAAYGIFDGDVWCDANGQVYTHSDSSSDQVALGIYGWTDDRGQYQ